MIYYVTRHSWSIRTICHACITHQKSSEAIYGAFLSCSSVWSQAPCGRSFFLQIVTWVEIFLNDIHTISFNIYNHSLRYSPPTPTQDWMCPKTVLTFCLRDMYRTKNHLHYFQILLDWYHWTNNSLLYVQTTFEKLSTCRIIRVTETIFSSSPVMIDPLMYLSNARNFNFKKL